MKIRIFALAKELDLDSKLLIEYCAKAGIVIKNSALASISPDEKDRVMEIIRAADSHAPAASAKPAVLTRETAPEVAGVRQLRTMTSRPQPTRTRAPEPEPEPLAEEPPPPSAAPPIAVAQTEVEKPPGKPPESVPGSPPRRRRRVRSRLRCCSPRRSNHRSAPSGRCATCRCNLAARPTPRSAAIPKGARASRPVR